MALYILLATIPAVLFGLLLKSSGYLDAMRADKMAKLTIVGWTAIVYGIILYLADRFGPDTKRMEDMNLPPCSADWYRANVRSYSRHQSLWHHHFSSSLSLGFLAPKPRVFHSCWGCPPLPVLDLLTFKEAHDSGVSLSGDIWLAAGLSFLASSGCHRLFDGPRSAHELCPLRHLPHVPRRFPALHRLWICDDLTI